jgi:DNA (cytosine-5)-methyltransferase 1
MVNEKTKHKEAEAWKIPVLSFFTGGGFLDIGFEKAGFEIVWTNEAEKNFADMYSYGMALWRKSVSSENVNAAISAVSNIEQTFAPAILKDAFKGNKPSFFGIIGGPPCPDFSPGGKNEGGKGMNGRLSKTYVHRICSIKPSFFVFENVPGLHNTKKHREFLTKLENILEKKNYCLDLKILNSLDFGLPQDRERLFMIGVKKDIFKKCMGRTAKDNERGWFPWPVPKYENAKKSYDWPDVVQNGNTPVKPSDIPYELTVHSVFSRQNNPSKLPNGKDCFKPYSDKFDIIKEGDTHRKSFKRLHRFRFSPTVCYGHNEVHLHPTKKRRLSVREAMRLQGIPDTYALPEDASLTDKFAIVSNGVPVPLSYEVSKSLYAFFESRNILNQFRKS